MVGLEGGGRSAGGRDDQDPPPFLRCTGKEAQRSVWLAVKPTVNPTLRNVKRSEGRADQWAAGRALGRQIGYQTAEMVGFRYLGSHGKRSQSRLPGGLLASGWRGKNTRRKLDFCSSHSDRKANYLFVGSEN